MDDEDFDDLEPTYEEFRHNPAFLRLVLPVVVLLVVVAIVAGLVWGGVFQGEQPRVGPDETAPTTEATVQIAP